LDFQRGKLGITKDRSHYNRHCLLNYLDTDVHFGRWLRRIKSVGDDALEDILQEAVDLGLPRELARRGVEFLRTRRDTLPRLIEDHQHEFLGISQWSLAWNP
jgi:hypothetical protein